MNIKVIVQTCPFRRKVLPQTLEAIEASDIGPNYEVMEHPEGMELGAFFLSVMRRIRDSGADYCIRLEDDVHVATHILHNVETWSALHEPNFGAGWLFSSQGILEDMHGLRRGRLGELYRETAEVHCALAVLLPVALMPQLYPLMEEMGGLPQDFAMSRAVWALDRRCYLHVPALGENRIEWPSARGHDDHKPQFHCAGPYFKPSFKRPAILGR